jgi:hypothetical protein
MVTADFAMMIIKATTPINIGNPILGNLSISLLF